MKRKILLLGVVLALILTMVMPFSIIGAKPAPLSCSGSILGITPGIVAPAGTLVSNPLIMANNSQSGQWRVIERDIKGTINTGLSTSEEFVLSYKGVFEVPTQKGNFHGRLTIGDYVFEVNGKADPLTAFDIGGGIILPKLTISGKWTCIQGPYSNGSLNGWAVFMPTPEGHVDYVIFSDFSMISK